MSSTAGQSVHSQAPWRAYFLSHMYKKMDSPEFVLSTLHPTPEGSPTPYLPTARFCIFRGMWTELPENKHNDAPRNDGIFDSDMPTFTTDVRMLKVPDIFLSGPGGANAAGRDVSSASGGGGPVEAVFWVKEEQVQWRFKGEAFVVGPDIEGEGQESSGVRTVKSELGKRMRVLQEGREKEWSWATEMTAHFGNLSPGMRGSFKQPPPGQRKSEPYDEEHEKMGEKVDSLDDETCRKNFRVVVIRPRSVEETHLDPGKGLRKLYTFKEESGEWETIEEWP